MEKSISLSSNFLLCSTYIRESNWRAAVGMSPTCEPPLGLIDPVAPMVQGHGFTSHGPYTVICQRCANSRFPSPSNTTPRYTVTPHLGSIQGIPIPVCLGAVKLILPYYLPHERSIRALFSSRVMQGVPVF